MNIDEGVGFRRAPNIYCNLIIPPIPNMQSYSFIQSIIEVRIIEAGLYSVFMSVNTLLLLCMRVCI